MYIRHEYRHKINNFALMLFFRTIKHNFNPAYRQFHYSPIYQYKKALLHETKKVYPQPKRTNNKSEMKCPKGVLIV